MIPFCEHPRAYSAAKKGIPVMVVLDVEDFYENHEEHHANNYLRMLGFERDSKHKSCTILGELANMPNHYVVVGNNGTIVSGLHGDIFYVRDDDYWS